MKTFLLAILLLAATTTADAQNSPPPKPPTRAASQPTPKLPFTVSKETTIITAPLNPDGTPDYIAALNQKYGKGVTPENNGWVSFLDAVGTNDNLLPPKTGDKILQIAGAMPTSAGVVVFQSYSKFANIDDTDQAAQDKALADLKASGKRLWTQAEYPQIAAYLQSQNVPLDKIVAAAARPRWWIPSVSDDGRSMFATTLPAIGVVRSAAYALAARATFRARRGDVQGFIRDVVVMKRLGRHLESCPTLIEQLVGAAIDALGNDPLGAVAGSGALSEVQCKTLLAAIDALPAPPESAEGIDFFERWTQLDLAVLLAMGNMPDGDGKQLFQTIDREAVNWNIVLKRVNVTMDILVANAKKTPAKELINADTEFERIHQNWGTEAKTSTDGLAKYANESTQAYSERVARAFMAVYMPSLVRADELILRSRNLSQMATVLLMAAQVKAKTGNWPAKLQDLVPTMLKEVPSDLYPIDSPGPWIYTITPAGIRISSVGDGKNVWGVGIQLPQ